MQDNHNNGGSIGNKTMEIATALVIMAFGAIVMWDSYRLGAGWSEDGPQSGAFPFYVALLIIISSIVTLIGAVRESAEEAGEFAEYSQIKMVLAVLIPSIVYIAAIHFIGIYVASIIFIAFFMIWQGKFSIVKSAIIAILVNVFFFAMFEIWFKIPLPKGPLEAAFGY